MREKSLASRRKEAVSLMHVGEPVRRYARSGFAANQTCAFFAPAIHSRRMCTLFRVSWQSDQVSMQQQKPAENKRSLSSFSMSMIAAGSGLARVPAVIFELAK